MVLVDGGRELQGEGGMHIYLYLSLYIYTCEYIFIYTDKGNGFADKKGLTDG